MKAIFSFLLCLFVWQCSNTPLEIDYSKLPGKTDVLRISYRNLYGLPNENSSRPKLNGVEFEYSYAVDGLELEKKVFFSKNLDRRLMHFIDANQIDSIIVRYDLEQPSKSIIKVRE